MTRRALSFAVLLLGACDLYSHSFERTASTADASLDDPACSEWVLCEAGSHCEVQCSQYGPVGCPYNCHPTCMPDLVCASVDTCMPPSQCFVSCADVCQAMGDNCEIGCAMPDGSCAWITDEAACKARGDCMPKYRASGCSCLDTDTCTCTDEMVSFVRCASTTVP